MRIRSSFVALATASLVALAACGGTAQPASSPAAPATGQAASGSAKEQLAKLVTQAKQEGELDTATTTEQSPRVPQVKEAFNKMFGLNLNINVALGDQAGKLAKMITTLDAGSRPEFDTLTGSENDLIQLQEKGYLTKIDNWEALLAETNSWVRSGAVKPEDVSPPPFNGSTFVWSTRSRALMFNTKLITEDKVPQKVIDLADPQFKGKFSVPPWTDTWETGTMLYKDKAAWLQTLDQIGKNAFGVIDFSPALSRLLLGEFPFAPMNSYYYYDVKAKDPQAPVGLHWFKDYTSFSKVQFIVPKGSKHPAAATLWTLFMTTPEAEAAWQPAAHEENIAFGQSEQDKIARKSLQESGSYLANWYANTDTLEQLKWWSSNEGKAYRGQIKEAITQRK